MVKNNPYYIKTEIKKPIETVYEIKDEYKVPSFEEFMKAYEMDEKVNDSYEKEIENYDSIEVKRLGGPMYNASFSSNNRFSIKYSFNHGGDNLKPFFKIGQKYTTEWNISGDLWKLKEELWKLEDGEIGVFKLVDGKWKRDYFQEEDVKKSFRKDIREFEILVRDGKLEPNQHYARQTAFSTIV